MEQSQTEKLIIQSQQGNARAFAVLVTEYQSMVFRLAFRLLCDENEARDMVQETFVKVWLSLSTYNSRYRFSTWLYKIATNVSYDRLRVLQRTPGALDTSLDFSGLSILSGENVEESLINREIQELINGITAGLPPVQRLVFTLRELEELDTEEIRVITGLSASQIKSNLYLAKKQIREQMEKLNIRL